MAYVQNKITGVISVGANPTVTMTSAPAQGNLLVLGIVVTNLIDPAISLAGWNQIGTESSESGGAYTAWFWKASAGSSDQTITLSASFLTYSIEVEEWTGFTGTPCLDLYTTDVDTSSNNTTTTSVLSALHAAGELVVSLQGADNFLIPGTCRSSTPGVSWYFGTSGTKYELTAKGSTDSNVMLGYNLAASTQASQVGFLDTHTLETETAPQVLGVAAFTDGPIITSIVVTGTYCVNAGGSAMTINGEYFTGATNVTVNGVSVTNLSVTNDFIITCNAPANPTGSYTVVVTTPVGSSGNYNTVVNQVTYQQFVFIQDVGNTGAGASPTYTLPSNPAVSQLLVMTVTALSINNGAYAPTFTTPTGWTAIGSPAELIDTQGYTNYYLWSQSYYKASVGSADKTATFTGMISPTPNFGWGIQLDEFHGFVGAPVVDLGPQTQFRQWTGGSGTPGVSTASTSTQQGAASEIAYALAYHSENSGGTASSYYYGLSSGTKYDMFATLANIGTPVTRGYALNVASQATNQWEVDFTGDSPMAQGIWGITFADSNFLVPTITNVSPTTGLPTGGGATITITGTNLGSVTGVTINGVPATNLMVISPTTITVTSPALPSGTYTITVTNPGGTASQGGVQAAPPSSFINTGNTLTGLVLGAGSNVTGVTMPTQSIGLMLADPWTTDDFTDITPFVKMWNGKVRGRQHELQLFQTGVAALTLEGNLSGGRFNPWNTGSVYYNLVSPDDGSQDASNGTWGHASNCSLAAWPTAPPVVLDGPYALKMTCNGSTPSTLRTASNVYPVVAGNSYTAMASFLTSVTARSCKVRIAWYRSDGTTLISTTDGSVITDSTTAWTKSTAMGVVAPALAAYAAVQVSVASAANNEVHWICRAALFNYTSNVPNTAWAPGQRGLVPTRTVKATATWAGVTYPVFRMYVDNWTPKYGKVKSEQVINLSDGMKLLSQDNLNLSAWMSQSVTDGATQQFRLGDPIGATQVLESISNTEVGQVYNQSGPVTFGAAGPFLTDDTTAVTVTGGASDIQPGGYIILGQSLPGTISGTAYSVEAWFTMPSSVVVGTGSPADQTFPIFATSTGAIALNGPSVFLGLASGATYGGMATAFDYNYPGGSIEIIGNTPLNDGTYHQLVYTRAGTTARLYLDGVELTSGHGGSVAAPSPQTLASNWSQLSSFYEAIGVVPSANGQPVAPQSGSITWGGSFQGTIANVTVYNGVTLTASEISALHGIGVFGFQVQYSGQRIQQVLNLIGWPSSLQNLSTGVSLVQGTTQSLTSTAALSYIQQNESTELGAFFCDPSGIATFYDRHYIITATAATISNGIFSDQDNPLHYHFLPDLVPAMDDLDLWNDVPSQNQGGVLQRSESTTSIKQYTKRTLTGYTSGLQTNDNENLAQSQWLLAHYDTPYTRCRQITLSSVTDSGKNIAQMLGRSIFDLITLLWKPIDASTVYFNQPSLIEWIQHDVTQSEWKTTWGLSPAETQPYLILNDPIRGQLSTDNLLGY